MEMGNEKLEAYRQYTKQGRFACILQADHGDIHLGGPAGKIRIRTGAFSSAGTGRGGWTVFPRTKKRLNGPTYQNILKSQS